MAQHRIGRRAPSFSLESVDGAGRARSQVSLYLDGWLVLLFYPRDFSMICPTELTAVSGRIPEFQDRGCEVLGVSTDDIETHARWLTTGPQDGGLGPLAFPLAEQLAS